MNQIKELKNKNNNRFIIEISILLLESQKKITVSLFINASVTVLELKEFISKDFGFPSQSMIFFYPIKGIIDNSYKFSFEPNKKVLLDLIIDNKKIDINKKKDEIALKDKDFEKLLNINIHDNNLLNAKNNIRFNYLFNNFSKTENNKKNIIIENPHKELINPILINKENQLNDKLICHDHEKNNYNINPKINNMLISENLKKNSNLDNNNNLFNMKSSKCNFISTKIDSKKNTFDLNVLGKKRNFQTTFKTTIQNKENENTKSKNLIKSKNISNFKIVNFNVNKNITLQSEINKP